MDRQIGQAEEFAIIGGRPSPNQVVLVCREEESSLSRLDDQRMIQDSCSEARYLRSIGSSSCFGGAAIRESLG